MTDRSAHFYSPLSSTDALLPRTGSINWAERRQRAVSAEARGIRIGLLIFWTVVATLLLARVALVGTDAPQTDAAARATPISQTASSASARP